MAPPGLLTVDERGLFDARLVGEIGQEHNDDAAAYLSRRALQVSCAQEVHFLT